MILQIGTAEQQVSTRMDEEQFNTGRFFHPVQKQGSFYLLEKGCISYHVTSVVT
jgi:hypothetical protein